MMKKFALLLALISFFACDNTLEINAPYKDISIVYGILDGQQDTNWVRIHKSYLGTEGIDGGNNNPDSLYYQNLQVRIEELDVNGNIVGNFPLVKDSTSKQLQTGFFTTEGYRLYRFDKVLNDTRTYRLVIEKPSGDQVTATTPLVRNYNITKPSAIQRISFGKVGQDFTWEQAANARMYQAFLRFYYVEVNANRLADSTRKYVDYVMPTKLGSNLTGTGNDILVNIAYETYYRFLFNAIGTKDGVNRFFRGMDLYVVAAADDMATYINVSQPAEGIVQDKPFYSNVTNGAGIFSSRRHAQRLDMMLSNASLDSLIKGLYTCDLRFAKAVAGDTCLCDRATTSGFRCE